MCRVDIAVGMLNLLGNTYLLDMIHILFKQDLGCRNQLHMVQSNTLLDQPNYK